MVTVIPEKQAFNDKNRIYIITEKPSVNYTGN